MGQSIQEWTQQNLWKTAFKNFCLVHSWILFLFFSRLTTKFFDQNWNPFPVFLRRQVFLKDQALSTYLVHLRLKIQLKPNTRFWENKFITFVREDRQKLLYRTNFASTYTKVVTNNYQTDDTRSFFLEYDWLRLLE